MRVQGIHTLNKTSKHFKHIFRPKVTRTVCQNQRTRLLPELWPTLWQDLVIVLCWSPHRQRTKLWRIFQFQAAIWWGEERWLGWQVTHIFALTRSWWWTEKRDIWWWRLWLEFTMVLRFKPRSSLLCPICQW